jgi:6-phosphogluconolactonase (cycloisomerase 2 family)
MEPWKTLAMTLLLALTAGCGGGGGESGPPGASRFVYASAYKSGSATASGGIYVYQFDPGSGAVMAVAGSPFATGAGGSALAMSRDAKYLYSIDGTTGSLLAFGIEADGSLVSIPGAFGTADIWTLIANPTADFLYAIGSNGTFDVYAINSTTGALTLQPAGSIAYQGGPPAISPDGNHLYAATSGLSTAAVFEYAIDRTTGALTALAGSPVQTDAIAFLPYVTTIDPSGRFMYVTSQAVASGFGGPMGIYSIDPQTGTVSLTSLFSPTPGPQTSVAVDASGKYAVVCTTVTSKTGPNPFSVQRIDETDGTLSAVPGSPFPGDCLTLLADPSGSYVYAGSEGGVSVYSLNESTGVPHLVTSSTLPGMVVASLAVTP